VRDQARQVAQALQLKSTWELDLAAMLCPIGNVSLPAELNQKVHAELDLTGAEKDAVARVPQVGHDLLIKIPRLEAVARIVLYQNKNFDGTGFPSDAVKSEEIPVEARILRALTDLAKLEARKIPRFKALDQLRQQPGHYDLKVLDAVARCFHLTPGSQPEAAAKSPVALDFPDLRPGHVLSANIVTKQDILIVGAGTKITPLILERLRNFASLSGLKLPIYVEG
jgi:HD-GYP domain-containing protein (c-di-GMP phosphodiesterase class II)